MPIFRYVTHEDIQQAKLKRRRRRHRTTPETTNPETTTSSRKQSVESRYNGSDGGSSTSQSRSLNGGSLTSHGCGINTRGIDTSLLYDPLELNHRHRGRSVCSYDRFGACRIKTITIL